MESVVHAARTVLLWTARWFDRARALCVSLSAGTLGFRQLRAGIEDTWSGFVADESEIASGWDPAEAAIVARFISAVDRVLVIGCGTGRDLIPLLRMGCEVVGIDPVPEIVAMARRELEKRQLQSSIVEGYFEDTAVPGRFDVVLFSNHTYSYIPERSRRVAVLKKAADLLSPRGRILATYLASRAPFRPRMLRAMQAVARLTRSDWRPERGDHLEPLDGRPGRFAYEHFFGPGELEHEAADASLIVLPHREHPHARQMLVLTRAPYEEKAQRQS